ncbi:hypothetical protein [Pluralibacter sp.]|uniref:hypothetical protein n=1 Tax=Pluralibacter sp. TaxID=1920032 RepID=UPI0025D101F8|nr:hypothetical protein [Pluralibacter sp.]MBV8042115.1 hypothetical protein [Pluralibacter sp.]
MKHLMVVFVMAFLLTGCATGSPDDNTDAKEQKYEASLPDCTEDGATIDCDWKNVSDKWSTVSRADFNSTH